MPSPFLFDTSLMPKKMTVEERLRLSTLISEATKRGIVLTPDLFDSAGTWRLPPSGYFSRQDGKLYEPNDIQERFVNREKRFSALISARGGGKTAAGAQKGLRKVQQGYSGVVGNPDFENFKYSTWPELKLWIPWEHVVSKHRYRQDAGWDPVKPFVITFKNGATITCKGIKSPDAARGPNINWFWYDEGGRDLDGMSWLVAIASVRVGENPQAWVTTTPRGIDHWLYDFFVEKNIPKDIQKLVEDAGGVDEVIEWFETSIEDNKHNLDPMFYTSMMMAYPEGHLREQELHGKFVHEGGSLGSPAWFIDKKIPLPLEDFFHRVRYWDLAATEKKVIKGRVINDPDETVGTKMSWNGESLEQGEFSIENQIGGFWEWEQIQAVLLRTAKIDGPGVKIFIEQEPASGGKNQVAALIQYIKGYLPGWTVDGHNPRNYGDKVMRANHWFAEAAHGKITLVEGEWNKKFLAQLGSFPIGLHDDRIDSVSGARLCLAPVIVRNSIEFNHI